MMKVELLAVDPPDDGVALATDWMTKIVTEGDLNTWYVFSIDGEKPRPLVGALAGPVIDHIYATPGWEVRRCIVKGDPNLWTVYARVNDWGRD
jgi:hypothetical protein